MFRHINTIYTKYITKTPSVRLDAVQQKKKNRDQNKATFDRNVSGINEHTMNAHRVNVRRRLCTKRCTNASVHFFHLHYNQ